MTVLKLNTLFCVTVRLTGPTQVIEFATPKSPRDEVQLTATLYCPDERLEAIQSKLWAETVLSLKLKKHPLGKVVATHRVEIAENRLLLIWTNRESYVTGYAGVRVGLAPPPTGVTATDTSTPASAELDPMNVLVPAALCLPPMVASVRRPITAEGLMTNTFPLPPDVFIPAEKPPMHALSWVSPQTPFAQVWPVKQSELLAQEPPALFTH